MLKLGENFGNKIYFSKKPSSFPLDKDRKQLNTTKLFVGSRSPLGALRVRRRFAAITGPNFCTESYPLLASSQHVGANAAVTFLPLICCLNHITCILYVALG